MIKIDVVIDVALPSILNIKFLFIQRNDKLSQCQSVYATKLK